MDVVAFMRQVAYIMWVSQDTECGPSCSFDLRGKALKLISNSKDLQ